MDIQRIDLNLLLVFDALYDTGSATAAAKRLKLSQPTVSVALGKLRATLDDELFVRSANGMSPTPRAQRLREPVRRLLDLVANEILPSERYDPTRASRPFTICLSDVGEMVFLPALMQKIQAIAPSTPVVSVSLRPQELTQALETGQVDLALGYFPDLDAGIIQQGLFEHAFVCLARRGHPQVHAGEVSLQAFLQLDHLVVSADGRSQEIFERVMQARRDERHVSLRTPHFMSAPLIIAKSDMVTTVPKAVGAVWAARANLQMFQPPMPVPPIPLKQFWHRRFNDDPRLCWLRGLVQELFLGRDPSDDEVFSVF